MTSILGLQYSVLIIWGLLTGSFPWESQQANLIFVGDAMQHKAQLEAAKRAGDPKEYDYSEYFTLIAPTIREADYAVANLEVPLGGGPHYTGYPCFSAPDAYAAALKDAGFDMLLTANNHCLDRSDRGVRRTLEVLDTLDVDHIGTYRNESERERLVPMIRHINGIGFGFLNYTYGTNGIKERDGAVVSRIERKRMAQEIKKTREAGAEIIVVCIHWGEEYKLLENASQRSTAQFLIDQGVDMIIGAHPHVIQPMHIVHNDKENKDVLLVYSLGNFISDMKTTDTRGGALVRAKIVRDAEGRARLAEANYDTFFTSKPTGAHDNYRLIPSWMPDSVPASQKGNFNLFNNSSKKIFDKHNTNVPALHP